MSSEKINFAKFSEAPAISGVQTSHTLAVQTGFVQHMIGLRGWILTFVPDVDQADDLVQETFLTAMEKAADFTPGTNFRAWIFAIARYKILTAARTQNRSKLIFETDVVEALADEMEVSAGPDEETLKRLSQCLEKLTRRAREAIKLRYIEALRPPVVAERMAVSVPSVNVTLARARRTLRDCVTKK